MLIERIATPLDLAALRRVAPARYPLLAVSSAAALDASARKHARWDMLLVTDGEGFLRDAQGQLRDLSGNALAGGFFDHLEQV